MKSFIQKSSNISFFFVLGLLTTALNAQQVSTSDSDAVEEIDIAKVADSVRIRSEELDKELSALTKDLPKKLTAIKEVEQRFEAMIKVVDNVLAYLARDGELAASLNKYNAYAESQSQLLRNSSIRKVQALAAEWDKRAARVVKLLGEVSNLRANGRAELNRLKENKFYAIQIAKLKMFDDALDATQESLDKVKGIVTDIKAISDKTEEVESTDEETTTE
jgi:hypothetical protein